MVLPKGSTKNVNCHESTANKFISPTVEMLIYNYLFNTFTCWGVSLQITSIHSENIYFRVLYNIVEHCSYKIFMKHTNIRMHL